MENATAYNIGDLVRLKSDGPVMVIIEINNNMFRCKFWSDDESKFKVSDFDFATLDLVQQTG